MGNSINACSRCYPLRSACRQNGIKYNRSEPGFFVATRHLLVRVLLRDQSKRLCFAAGTSSRWDTNGREHRFRGFVHTPIILHPPTVCQHEVDPFGAVHRTSTTKPDQQINSSLILRKPNTIGDMVACRILLDAIEYGDIKPRRFQGVKCSLRYTCPDDTRIGDEQCPCTSEFFRQSSQLV